MPTLPSGKSTIRSPGLGNSGCNSSAMPYSEGVLTWRQEILWERVTSMAVYVKMEDVLDRRAQLDDRHVSHLAFDGSYRVGYIRFRICSSIDSLFTGAFIALISDCCVVLLTQNDIGIVYHSRLRVYWLDEADFENPKIWMWSSLVDLILGLLVVALYLLFETRMGVKRDGKDGNNPCGKPLNVEFVARNVPKQADGISRSNSDTGTKGEDRQHDESVVSGCGALSIELLEEIWYYESYGEKGFIFIQISSMACLKGVLKHVWIKFYGVPVSAFTCDGLSVIDTRLSTPIMLIFVYYHHKDASLGHMNYARALVDIRDDRALEDTMVISVPTLVGNGVTMHTIKRMFVHDPLISKHGTGGTHSLPKQQVPKFAYQRKTTSTLVSNAFSALEKNDEKPMDDLVDDTRKKVGVPPRKTDI
ncbi:hypothetical protein Tco_0925744 [Tanacetum coccineum]|uniref:Uncharacterized protein n=1 Tax=Tanacetum coccineum TaxID=301880 RepID=A0ABQ5D7Q8_9ASTR